MFLIIAVFLVNSGGIAYYTPAHLLAKYKKPFLLWWVKPKKNIKNILANSG